MVLCEGPIRASSESMTHGLIYGVLPEVGAVIHIHNRRLWDTLINHVPTTRAETAYGTPALCAEVTKLLSVAAAAAEGVIVMAGHVEGSLSSGGLSTRREAVCSGWWRAVRGKSGASRPERPRPSPGGLGRPTPCGWWCRSRRCRAGGSPSRARDEFGGLPPPRPRGVFARCLSRSASQRRMSASELLCGGFRWAERDRKGVGVCLVASQGVGHAQERNDVALRIRSPWAKAVSIAWLYGRPLASLAVLWFWPARILSVVSPNVSWTCV